MKLKRPMEHRKLAQWHDYFAWMPVRVGDEDVRWLETVERMLYSQTPLYDGRVLRDRMYRAKDRPDGL
jgi:hypothetical protein